ncbi:MAG: hypothetical protein KC422_16815 [Trueperaceae bacterium]|nr:hypothetical protein [Trueperaceae bacterium]
MCLLLAMAQETSPLVIPDLPFADNPDPNLCGIPEPWLEDDPAWLTGYYEGKLIAPQIFLYDSHLRRKIVAQVKSGAEIKILLRQVNPSLNYYLVRTLSEDPAQEGWVPEPFLSFEPLND